MITTRLGAPRTVPIATVPAGHPGDRPRRWLQYGARMMVGLFLGAVLGPPIQKWLALVSVRFLVPVALATVSLALVGLAIERTARDLRRGRRDVWAD